MQNEDLKIREVPARTAASRSSWRRANQQTRRTQNQLLLVSSALDAAAVAELADKERQRATAARAEHRERAAVLALADRERIRAGCSCSVGTSLVAADDEDVSALAKRTLRDSWDQFALERRVVPRLAAGLERSPRRKPTDPEPPACA